MPEVEEVTCKCAISYLNFVLGTTEVENAMQKRDKIETLTELTRLREYADDVGGSCPINVGEAVQQINKATLQVKKGHWFEAKTHLGGADAVIYTNIKLCAKEALEVEHE